MTIVRDLLPGEIVTLGNQRWCFVARTQHPVWRHLQLVIWRGEDGSWSHDALNEQQEVGSSDQADYATRMKRLHPKPVRGLAGGAFDKVPVEHADNHVSAPIDPTQD